MFNEENSHNLHGAQYLLPFIKFADYTYLCLLYTSDAADE